jgi:WD40 repeat protein
MALSHNGRFVLSGGGTGVVRVWEARARDMVSQYTDHRGGITALAVYADDSHALSGSRDRSFRCWDLRREKCVSAHMQRGGAVAALALVRDQSLVATTGGEKKLLLWDLREAAPVQSIAPVHGDGEGTAVASMAGRDVLATGGTDAVVRLWDVRSPGAPLAECVGHTGAVRHLAFAPDDKQLVSVGDDGCVLVWNVYA